MTNPFALHKNNVFRKRLHGTEQSLICQQISHNQNFKNESFDTFNFLHQSNEIGCRAGNTQNSSIGYTL